MKKNVYIFLFLKKYCYEQNIRNHLNKIVYTFLEIKSTESPMTEYIVGLSSKMTKKNTTKYDSSKAIFQTKNL